METFILQDGRVWSVVGHDCPVCGEADPSLCECNLEQVEMAEALQAFKSAAIELSRAWEAAPADAVENYPRGWASFDEVARLVQDWRLRDLRISD